MKNNFLLLLALLLFAACQKQPTANFNTDKTLYYAGETVHLTDASTNAQHWYWTMPDGTYKTGQTVDYVIDTNDLGGNETFALTVTSKNGNKLSTISKTVQISQPIDASDYFSHGTVTNQGITYPNFISTNHQTVQVANISTGANLTIYFPENYKTGTYQVKSYVASNTALIEIRGGKYDSYYVYGSDTGTLTISPYQNGLFKIAFNKISVQGSVNWFLNGVIITR
jgi:PKD repeat protein